MKKIIKIYIRMNFFDELKLRGLMEYTHVSAFSQKLSRIALGTWAIGGSLWGGTEEKKSVDTILSAFNRGINVIDTAPAYGAGTAEIYLAKALKVSGKRKELILSTKCGIQIQRDGNYVRNLTASFIREDLHNSLKRLETDYVDIYFAHWPDPLTPIEETAEEMHRLLKEGKIRSIGVSNFSLQQLKEFIQVAPCHFFQPPYNLFERDIEKSLISFCKKNQIALMTYSALCRGLLSGKVTKSRKFPQDDLRSGMDPKYQHPFLDEYISAAEQLKILAKETYHRSLLEFAIRWILDKGIEIAIWGARHPDQLDPIHHIFDWKIEPPTMKKVDDILKETIKHPQGLFSGPGLRGPLTN